MALFHFCFCFWCFVHIEDYTLHIPLPWEQNKSPTQPLWLIRGQHNSSQMMVPVSIVTWISHLVIKAPSCWMSNDCNISVFMSVFLCPSVFLCLHLSFLSGFSARRLMNRGLSENHQPEGLKNTVPIFVL